MLKLALIGDPVAHSRSPGYHGAFLAAAGLAGTYEALRAPAGSGAARIEALRAAGYLGLNVTTPLKEEAFARADRRDPAAMASGAVNTLVLGARLDGYNTDGAGAVGALAAAGEPHLRGKRILVLGAGPTARAVAHALASEGARLFVWNRTPAGAQRLAAATGGTPWAPGDALDAAFATLPPHAGIESGDLLAALAAVPVVIDANYGERATLGALLRRGDVHDGRAMLYASTRASFDIFTAALRRGGDSNSRDL